MNNVQLIGRIVRDIELKYTAGGTAVARFAVAVDRPVREGAERQSDFPSVVAFGRQAETIEKFFRKGSRIGITGRLQTGSYADKDGRAVFTTDVIVNGFDFCESRGASGGAADDQRGAAKRPAGSSDGVQETFGSQDYRRRTRKIQKLTEPEILPTFEEIDADVPF